VKYRHRVLTLLATLSVLTYLDRVCISVAGPRIQSELSLSPQDWGLVTGAFAIAYALFEIPSGYLGDRFGARAMLARIVLWWSAFTTLTGFVSKLGSLVIIRFLFGAGEAGAYPTASTYYFFLFWLPTYMMRARGFTEGETKLSALPFVLGALANLIGGYARDAAVRRWGLKWGPRVVGIAGLATASASAFGALISVNKYVALGWLALCYGGITFQQPTVWATCVDIGKRYAGAVAGCMNTAGAVGGLVSSVIFGYLVQSTGSYDAVLLSMVGMLILGAGLWLRTDATQMLASPGTQTKQPAPA